MSKLFFALWPDDQTRQELVQLSQAIQAAGIKPVHPQNLHVTLVFLGNVDLAAELLVKQGVEAISAEPFVLMFDQISYWSRPKILCLTCQQPAKASVTTLVAALDAAVSSCGIQTDKRPYLPHITLARHAGHLPDITIKPIVWRAESFCLVESCSEPDGVHYKVMQRWPFTTSVS
ncbi:MAG: RNA 2',3'-cyclic phosphodiesterase [Methylobacter sp.]|jgi:2'-5' RNA ligase